MNNNTLLLKQKLLDSWDQMKSRFPVVLNIGAVKGDSVKEDFLSYIDGLRCADEIRDFFTLDTSDAHAIFSDLLNCGAIRFLQDAERFPFLKNQNSELRKKIDFLLSEKDKLSGEELYLTSQIVDTEKTIKFCEDNIPKLKQTIEEISGKLDPLKQSATELWDSNSELLGLTRDMKNKERQIRLAVERLEEELPKVMRKKTRMITQIKTLDTKVNVSNIEKTKVEKKLLLYREAIDEVSEYLEDTKGRIDDMVRRG